MRPQSEGGRLLAPLGCDGGLSPPDEGVGCQPPAQPVAVGGRLAQAPAGPDLVPVQRAAQDGVTPEAGVEVRTLLGRTQERHAPWYQRLPLPVSPARRENRRRRGE